MQIMDHVMIDLETLSVRPNAAVLSIGACYFDPKGPVGHTGPEFYRVVNIETCIRQGMVVDDGTFNWWMNQSQEARDAISKARKMSLYEALSDFKLFWQGVGGIDGTTGEQKHLFDDKHGADMLWAHGTNFDEPIMHFAYASYALERPWPYNHVRDTRGLFDFTGVWPKKDAYPDLTAHNALSDAIRQARDVQHAYRAQPDVKALAPPDSEIVPLRYAHLSHDERQRRSFAFGNCAIDNPLVTREMVNQIADAGKA